MQYIFSVPLYALVCRVGNKTKKNRSPWRPVWDVCMNTIFVCYKGNKKGSNDAEYSVVIVPSGKLYMR